MKVAVLQSNFIPWRGYFDLINSVDKFILYDCVQYTKNDWRNRNKILSKNGIQWLTLQVIKPYSKCSIDKVSIEKRSLIRAISSLEMSYRNANTFCILEELVITPMKEFAKKQSLSLSELNEIIIRKISSFYDINTDIVSSSELSSESLMSINNKVERLIALITSHKGNIYLSGPSGLNYLEADKALFADEGIDLRIMRYPKYSQYAQFSANFVDDLSIVDFIAHIGDQKSNLFK